MPKVVEICQLIVPLRNDPNCVLEERDHDQEASNSGQISTSVQHSNSHVIPYSSCFTYGLIGSDIVSSQSSILLVCSLMASRGLGSFVASAFILL